MVIISVSLLKLMSRRVCQKLVNWRSQYSVAWKSHSGRAWSVGALIGSHWSRPTSRLLSSQSRRAVCSFRPFASRRLALQSLCANKQANFLSKEELGSVPGCLHVIYPHSQPLWFLKQSIVPKLNQNNRKKRGPQKVDDFVYP